MTVWSTTKMMNLLTLVLVTLPGLTVSFSNGRYVCCNQPPTPPSPQPRSNMRSLILSLAKRDDRDALFREARMYGSGRMGDSLPDYPSNIPGVRDEGSYRDTDLTRRDPLLTRILHVLRSPGQQRPSRYGSSAALSTSDGGARSMDFDASPFIGKRGDGAREKEKDEIIDVIEAGSHLHEQPTKTLAHVETEEVVPRLLGSPRLL
ncbi:uncharacterized protein LOC143294363 isoform X8 [Babylonia areolata]|uniref:uncharacterized protein LOC143294363 isoform X8 n=1 Tax=Babylonia areolata TaxID=304850 RepID=UPI003FD3AB36